MRLSRTCAYLVPPQERMSPTTYQHVLISIQHAPYRSANSVKGCIDQANPELHNTVPTETYSSFQSFFFFPPEQWLHELGITCLDCISFSKKEKKRLD